MTACCWFHSCGGHPREAHMSHAEALALYRGNGAALGDRLMFVHSWFPSETHGLPLRQYDGERYVD